jgi:hypothetical protein
VHPSALLVRANSNPVLPCLLGMAVGLFIFYRGFLLLQRRRILLDTPVSKVRSASLGLVELNGLAVGPFTVTAPITARDCYYYRTVVWEYIRSGKNAKWVKVAAECMHVPFFLDDNTGNIMVDPRGAELDLHRDFQQEFCDSFFTLKQKAPDSVHMLLSRHGIITNNRIKVEEFCIKPKNALFLLGTVAENPGIELTQQPIHDEEHNSLTFGKSLWLNSASPAPWNMNLAQVFPPQPPPEPPSMGQRLFGAVPHRDSAQPSPYPQSAMAQAAGATHPHVIHLSANSPAPQPSEISSQTRIAAALLQAGIVNPAAWSAAGFHDGKNSAANRTPTGDFETQPAVVIMKGRNDSPFLISWRSQRALARSLGWKCMLMIWGGPALTLLSLYGLLAFAHLV